MIVRFHIDLMEQGQYEYRVTHEGEDLYGDAGFAGRANCRSCAANNDCD
ncbi:MAG: hypothetical protein PHR71_04390 [Polaromonas sp.]|nr:hypothetical protein [Polaromonas sp.]